MAEYEKSAELAQAEEELQRATARLKEIAAMPHPVEPVKGAYKTGKWSKILLNAALVTLMLLVFFGKNYTGLLLSLFVVLGVSAVVLGKIEAKKGMQRYEADVKVFEAEKAAYEAAQAEESPLQYDVAVLRKKIADLKAAQKAEV